MNQRSRVTLWFVLFALLYGADAWLTHYGITHGGQELNPTVRAYWSAGNILAPLLFKGLGLALVALMVLALPARHVEPYLAFACLMFGLVDAWSLTQLSNLA